MHALDDAVLRELVAGSTRFNDLRRGVPRMSPALLSKRLKDLEAAGIVARVPRAASRSVRVRADAAGPGPRAGRRGVGIWGQRWVDTEASLKNLDPGLLMWDMRRNIDPTPMPARRCVIQIVYPDLPPARRNWWLMVEPGEDVDLCSVDPGFDVDLYVVTDLRTMTAIWMGYTALARAKKAEQDRSSPAIGRSKPICNRGCA